MLYPSFGPSKPTSEVDETTPLFRALGHKGLRLYKLIFDNNKKALVKEFFKDKFIKKIWPIMAENVTYKQCFSKPHRNDIFATYSYISSLTRKQFKLQLPIWWEQ